MLGETVCLFGYLWLTPGSLLRLQVTWLVYEQFKRLPRQSCITLWLQGDHCTVCCEVMNNFAIPRHRCLLETMYT